MDNQLTNKVPTMFWVIAGLALVWNLMGVQAFFSHVMMSPEALAALPAEQQELYAQHPKWLSVFYGIGVLAGLLGCVGLLMRKKWAVPVFVVSLLGVLVHMGYSLLLTDNIKVLGPTVAILPVIVILICIALVVYSKSAHAKGILT